MAETKLVTDPHGRQGYVTYGDGRFTITVEPISMKLLLDEIADAASELAATERATLEARVEVLEGALETDVVCAGCHCYLDICNCESGETARRLLAATPARGEQAMGGITGAPNSACCSDNPGANVGCCADSVSGEKA